VSKITTLLSVEDGSALIELSLGPGTSDIDWRVLHIVTRGRGSVASVMSVIEGHNRHDPRAALGQLSTPSGRVATPLGLALQFTSRAVRCLGTVFFKPVVDFVVAACATIIDEHIVFYVKDGPLRISHVAVVSKLATIYVLNRT
jgi:hypothetical protein